MRALWTSWAVGVAAVCHGALCWGQITVRVHLDATVYLQFEPMRARVTVENNTDVPVRLDGGQFGGRSDFAMRVTRNGEDVEKRNAVPFFGRLALDPGESRTLKLNVATHYRMARLGTYTLTAMVTQGGSIFAAAPVSLSVVDGIEIQKVRRTIPGYLDAWRRYSFRYWQRGDWEVAFLRVDDEGRGVCLGVFDLGSLLRFTEPRIDVDRTGIVTVQHQAGSDCLAYSIFQSDASGVRFLYQDRRHFDGRPYVAGRALQPPEEEAASAASEEPKRGGWRDRIRRFLPGGSLDGRGPRREIEEESDDGEPEGEGIW